MKFFSRRQEYFHREAARSARTSKYNQQYKGFCDFLASSLRSAYFWSRLRGSKFVSGLKFTPRGHEQKVFTGGGAGGELRTLRRLRSGERTGMYLGRLLKENVNDLPSSAFRG